MRRIGLIALTCLTVALVASAQERFVNAQLTSRDGRDLKAAFASARQASAGPSWIGYAVPAAEAQAGCCNDCWDGEGRRGSSCRLEEGGATSTRKHAPPEVHPTALEGSRELLVLWRIEGGQVDRIRPVGGACTLDAGGLPVHWLTDVRPADSIALLTPFAERYGMGKRSFADAALVALALHADVQADVTLESLTATGRPLELRKQAAFWMGVARGRRGFENLRRLAREDAQPEMREHVVFALTQSREPAATDEIIAVARGDPSPRVRGQALFWLSQKAGQRAAGTIAQALDTDPEMEVKEKAVFALSQLPREEGVPLLIQQARTNRDRRVRERALFWLGQSGDPRALSLFEEILKGR
jgi:HEAT repeat protein